MILLLMYTTANEIANKPRYYRKISQALMGITYYNYMINLFDHRKHLKEAEKHVQSINT